MPRHNPIDDTVPQRIARYGDLVPYKDSMSRSDNIPPEAMMMMSPDKVMPLMSPLGWEGRSKIAPVKGAPGLTITLAECPPGDSAGLHKHTNAVENFFCVQGVFEITWGDEGQFSNAASSAGLHLGARGRLPRFQKCGDRDGPPVGDDPADAG